MDSSQRVLQTNEKLFSNFNLDFEIWIFSEIEEPLYSNGNLINGSIF